MHRRQGTLDGHLGKPALSKELWQEARHIVLGTRKTIKKLDWPEQPTHQGVGGFSPVRDTQQAVRFQYPEHFGNGLFRLKAGEVMKKQARNDPVKRPVGIG